MPAAPVHHTDTTDVAWDGGAAEKALELPDDEKDAIAVGDDEFAFRDGDADATTKAAWWGPHHMVGDDGKPGDANQKACSAIVGILNGGMSGKGMVPDDTVQAVYDHVIAHLKDAGVADADLPELKSAPAAEALSKPLPAFIAARATRATDMRGSMERRVPAVRHDFELREVPNGTGGTNLRYTGFASVTTPGDGTGEYEMEDVYGPWVESLSVGAFTKTAAEADVAMLLNHEGMTLARTKPGTLKLSEETDGSKSPVAGVIGLYSEALLDPANMYVQAMRSAVERGDLDEMSFAFRVIRQEWNATYDRRWINEVSMDKGDVSLVNYGANPHTGGTVSLRQRRIGVAAEREAAMPIERVILRGLKLLREGKEYSAANLALLQQALDALVKADNVDIPAIVKVLQDMDMAVDEGRAALSTALGIPNTDGTPTDLEPTLSPPGTTPTTPTPTTRSAPALSAILIPDHTQAARAQLEALRHREGLVNLTYGQLRDALTAALQAAQPEDDTAHYIWVADFTDAYVIYELGWNEYFQVDYSVDDDGEVTLSGTPVAVMPQTTYVAMGADSAGIERRGRGFAPRSSRPPAEVRQVRVQVKSEPLVYERHSPHSIICDLMRPDPGAEQRLRRHGEQTTAARAARQRAALRGLDGGGFEYRVTPDTEPGFGGNFDPPLWLNQYFATARRQMRVLADLIPAKFAMPDGVSSINLPIVTKGTLVRPQRTNTPVVDQDVTDAVGSSTIVTLAGQADSALQLLEQSPAGAHIDWAFFMDMAQDYDADLEYQLLYGKGAALKQLLGVTNVATIDPVTYTDTTPTGKAMYPYFGQLAAQVGDNRKRPPECWLMRTARWAWVNSSEDSGTRPFGLPTGFYLGATDETPWPISGLMGWPVFLDDTISTTLGGTAETPGDQDEVLALRPSDLMLFEGEPSLNVYTEVNSAVMGVRVQMHNRVAVITNRYPEGIGVLAGSGFAIQTGF